MAQLPYVPWPDDHQPDRRQFETFLEKVDYFTETGNRRFTAYLSAGVCVGAFGLFALVMVIARQFREKPKPEPMTALDQVPQEH